MKSEILQVRKIDGERKSRERKRTQTDKQNAKYDWQKNRHTRDVRLGKC